MLPATGTELRFHPHPLFSGRGSRGGRGSVEIVRLLAAPTSFSRSGRSGRPSSRKPSAPPTLRGTAPEAARMAREVSQGAGVSRPGRYARAMAKDAGPPGSEAPLLLSGAGKKGEGEE
jgi:hypothetical protein